MTDTPAAAGTPRTSNEQFPLLTSLSHDGRLVVNAAFACKLERELSAYQAAHQRYACHGETSADTLKRLMDAANWYEAELSACRAELAASQEECLATFNLAAEQQARALESERLRAERDATLHKFFDDADLFTKYSMDSGATWQRYPLEHRIALAIAVCKDDTDAKERDEAERLLAAATKDLAAEKGNADMIANAWQRELCEQGIGYRPKAHWIDYMVLATRQVMALAKENGVRCCGNPDLCANMNCNTLLRYRLSPQHQDYSASLGAPK